MSVPPATPPSGRSPARRRGFTLMEMMISITIMLFVFAMAVPFFRAQARSVEQNAQRLDARAGGRYGASALDRELRVAGIDMPPAQPVLVQAQHDAVTVNGNLVARSTATGEYAVYVNPDADAGLTGSLSSRTRVTLPNSSWGYPDTTYHNENESGESEAETISYWVAPDAERPGYSALFRRVNQGEPRVVVRNVLVRPGVPVFRYFYVESDGRLAEVPASRLPLRHAVPMHGDRSDTGSVGFIDSVRVVRVRLQTVARDQQTGRTDTLTQESSIRIMNAGLLKRTSCGDAPRPPAYPGRLASPARVVTDAATGVRRVVLTFVPSNDEAGGERDVQRYAVYKRLDTAPEWGEPITSVVVSGAEEYTVEDLDVAPGRWVYGVSALDCTPRRSEIARATALEINP